jgi:hypothetical protein
VAYNEVIGYIKGGSPVLSLTGFDLDIVADDMEIVELLLGERVRLDVTTQVPAGAVLDLDHRLPEPGSGK